MDCKFKKPDRLVCNRRFNEGKSIVLQTLDYCNPQDCKFFVSGTAPTNQKKVNKEIERLKKLSIKRH